MVPDSFSPPDPPLSMEKDQIIGDNSPVIMHTSGDGATRAFLFNVVSKISSKMLCEEATPEGAASEVPYVA